MVMRKLLMQKHLGCEEGATTGIVLTDPRTHLGKEKGATTGTVLMQGLALEMRKVLPQI